MLRSGLWTREQFYADLAGQIAAFQSRPAHEWQSAEESSLNAWFEKYPLYRRGAQSVSYYNKGQLLGVLIDILLRDKTANRVGLDHLLRYLNEEYAKKGRFYEDSAGLRDAAVKLAGNDARPAVEQFFRLYVSGTAPLPMQEHLSRAGLELRVVDRAVADPGFMLAGGTLSASPREHSIALTVVQVTPGGFAERAGLRRGDRIVAANHRPLPPDFQEWLEARPPGEIIALRIRRGEEEKEITFALSRRMERNYFLTEDPAAKGPAKEKTSLPARIRESILTGSTEAP
jgi:predicted metalloprotease with PDZ domain